MFWIRFGPPETFYYIYECRPLCTNICTNCNSPITEIQFDSIEILSVSQGEVDAVHQCPEWQANNINNCSYQCIEYPSKDKNPFGEIQFSYMQILGVGKVGENAAHQDILQTLIHLIQIQTFIRRNMFQTGCPIHSLGKLLFKE